MIFIVSSMLLVSCENDIEEVKAVTINKNLPDVEGKGLVIEYTDSAKLKVKVLTPFMNGYETVTKPYYEFPKGIHVYFYNDSGKVTGELIANYAIYNKTTDLWEARNNVIGLSPKGDKLNTEQLFWDVNKKKFFSKKYTRITNANGDQHNGEAGFESNDDFSDQKLFGSVGSFTVKDEAL